MANFANVKKLNIKSETLSEFDTGIQTKEGEDTLILIGRHAGRSNKGFTSAMLRKEAANIRNRSKKITVSMLDRNRDEDQVIYSDHVLTGWRNCFDADGKVSPFSSSNCLDLLKAVDDFQLQDIINHYAEPMNFIREDEISESDAEELGKSSGKGSNGK